MAFCSGLWIPLHVLPRALQTAAPALPPYHLGQIALAAFGLPASGSIAGHVAALGGFTLLFGAIAWFGHTRKRARM
jgi:ABC-2 type transport system permease protein